MFGLDAGALTLIVVAVLVGAAVQAMIGMGVGMVSAPVIAIVATTYVPVVPLWLALVVSGYNLVRERSHVEWGAVAWSLPARVPGTVLGLWLAVRFTGRQLGVAVAVMVLLAVAVSLRSVTVSVTRPRLVLAGLAAGTTGTATSIGGPPVALLFQGRPPAQARSTMSVFFFGGVVLSLLGFAVTGHLPAASGLLALALLPVVTLGLWLGTLLRPRVAGPSFRRGVLLLCCVAAALLLARSI